MERKLRALLVEDLESDAALIVRLLEKSGYKVDFERVESEGEMRAALERQAWDIVLADFRLPNFDAGAALRVLHEFGEDIPFIIVSGSIGESAAVELMRSGAHDYLMKANLARLAPAVDREMRDAHARRERREAEERLALAITAARLGTFDYFPQANQVIWSEDLKRQFGMRPDAEVTYDDFLRGVHPEDRERVHKIVQQALTNQNGGLATAEYRAVGIEDGVERFVSARGQAFFDSQGRAVRFVGVTQDITERKLLEDQFRQAQKLESVGRLAGGIAHDFNNLLTVIGGFGRMILEELEPDHPLRESAELVCGASERATALTRQLLTFSRRQVIDPKNIVLNDLVLDIDKMLRRLIGESIDLVLALDPSAGVLRADPGQIEQVIMNLAVNAKDAMHNGGRLTIQTSRRVVDDRYAEKGLCLQPGTYVQLSVSDNGTGMTADVKAHIFEPFFTTKDQGKGTGLGLSTVYGIVKQSGGAVWVESEPGKGTTFQILFPAVAPEPACKGAASESVAGAGSGTILVAEDEPGVRDFIGRALTRLGYNVLKAPNGREALALSRTHNGKVDLLLTDVVMPDVGGVELAEKFTAERPGVPVLLMSGYAENLVNDGVAAGHIQKPFTSAALLAQVSDLLRS
jgi:PAS domain S-box-containing protein